MDDINTLVPHVKLHLNLKHPSFEDCYMFGYDSLISDLSEADNPFQLGTPESDCWLDGWWDAFYEKSPRHTFEDDLAEIQEVPNKAANDPVYVEAIDNFLIRILEISGMIAVSAFVGYQLLDIVA